jgi:voltage-gated potassium channel
MGTVASLLTVCSGFHHAQWALGCRTCHCEFHPLRVRFPTLRLEDRDDVTAMPPFPPAQRRRLIALGLSRALAVTIALVTLYYVVPLERLAGIPVVLSLSVGLLVLVLVTAYQVRAIMRARHPGTRGIEAVATTVPLFLVLFAAAYFVLSRDDPANFSTPGLTRSDALYFTVTVFATVGFGDITATSQLTRMLVTVQMILDLIVLGAVVRVFFGAVRIARGASAVADADVSPAPADPQHGGGRT